MHVIIEKELYDKAFVEKWTEGFAELRAHIAEFTVERCAEITWLPPEQIEAAAVTFARNAPASIGPGMGGVCQANDAFDLTRSLTILSAITGNLEVPGGNLRCTPPTGRRSCYGSEYSAFHNLPEAQARKKLGLDRFPILNFISIPSPPETVWPAVLNEKPYPVKAIGLFANNSLCAYANSPQVKEVMRKIDFLFAVDYFHTPTTAMADVILPPAHWSERDDVEDLLMKNHVFCQPKAVEPVPECRDEKQILVDLARKMGLDGYWRSVAETLDYRLEPIGMRFEAFKSIGFLAKPMTYRSYEQFGGFRTPSGKVGLHAGYLSAMGISPLPIFREPPESPRSRPDLLAEYPLVLTTGSRNLVYYHSSHRNIPSLRKHAPDPELQIHPQTAAKLGITDGEWVDLVSPRGRIEIRARFFEHIHPEVVQSPHGFWHGVENGWRRVNINMITDNQQLCPVTGSVPLKAMLCRVEKRCARTGGFGIIDL